VEKFGTIGQATNVNIIGHMLFTCLVNKFTDTHSEYIMLIAFPRQKSLRERASKLHFTYMACLVLNWPFESKQPSK
jgi:hypothetical protein